MSHLAALTNTRDSSLLCLTLSVKHTTYTCADCENSAGAAIRVEEEGVISLWPGGVIPYKLEFDDCK